MDIRKKLLRILEEMRGYYKEKDERGEDESEDYEEEEGGEVEKMLSRMNEPSYCRYCGADVFEEEAELEEIHCDMRKYGYIICPKCKMILQEDLVDE